jgi:hypothetical protein
VFIDLIISDGQTRVVEALDQKRKKSIELYENLVNNVSRHYSDKNVDFNKQFIKPKFI